MTQADPILYSDCAWPDLKKAIAADYVVILPVGSTEQHGPHLPLCTDDFMAQRWAYDAALVAKEKYGVRVLVTPGLHFGNAKHHMAFPGTLTLTFETLKNVVFELGDSILSHGFRKLVILNVHGGNRYAVGAAAIDLWKEYQNAELPVVIRVADDGDPDLQQDMFERIAAYSQEARLRKMVHGGALETSRMLYLREGAVRMERASSIDLPTTPVKEVYFMDDVTDCGAGGHPSEASREAGELQWRTLVKSLANYLQQMSKEDVSVLRMRGILSELRSQA